MAETPDRQIRALYDEHTIRVYQAYSDEIADSALGAGRFVSPPFSMTRMTWIKPSFLWMMYRSGWATKDTGQRRILAIDIDRAGFDWALAHGVGTHPDPGNPRENWRALLDNSPVRIQWDPERSITLERLPWRTVQIGLRGDAVTLYVNEWTKSLTDMTATVRDIHALVVRGVVDEARARLPEERPYQTRPSLPTA